MIISHDHRFILVKPGKVGGTAVELGLAGKLGESAIITPVSSFNPACDDDWYDNLGRNSYGFSEHMTPRELRKKVPELWHDYDIVTITRNPFDMVVSRWNWEKWLYEQFGAPGLHSYATMFRKFRRDGCFSLDQVSRKLEFNKARKRAARAFRNEDPASLVNNFPYCWTNDQYYFDEEGFVPDRVLRTEHLQEDFDQFCRDYSLEPSTLPRVKSKLTEQGIKPDDFYTRAMVAEVTRRFTSQFARFGYHERVKEAFIKARELEES